MNIVEVPSRIDLRLMRDAVEWERTAMNRPFRGDFFAAITNQLRLSAKSDMTILELGSGPGFLASYVLEALPAAKMVLLDFSRAMHDLAAKRLASYMDRVTFIERDFKEAHWSEGLTTFDAVVTIQAVHELRHKSYAHELHRQVKGLLKTQGQYLVCDHHFGDGGLNNDQLYMTIDEQRECLRTAGFDVADVLIRGGRALYRGT